MAGKGLNVKDISEVKRLWKLGLTNRKIARAIGAHRNTVNKYVEQFQREILNPELVIPIESSVESAVASFVVDLDWEKIRSEFLAGTSLTVIHEELLECNKTKLSYSGFWKQVNKRISLSEATMVRVFKPGSRTEIDYADGIEILDSLTGELRKTQFFVGALCNSRYAFAEFTWSQSSEDFLQSHVNMFEFFGGTTQVLSPDNLKSAVTKTHRYDPVVNQAYTRLADHYDVAVVPARVKTPKDKAIVERTIQIFQKYFFMKVRNRTFTSLMELNQCLREHLAIFNNKKHRIFKRTRWEMFLDEKSHLRALPVDGYKVAIYQGAKLSRDCHLVFKDNYYSAPHHLRGKTLDVWATAKIVEIYCDGDRVALHSRTRFQGKYVTDPSHYPPAQEAYAEENVQKIIERATKVGKETEALIKGLLGGEYPLKYLRRSQGIIALAWKYSEELLEAACLQANQFNTQSIQYLERVIKFKRGVKNAKESQQIERAYNPYLRGFENIH